MANERQTLNLLSNQVRMMMSRATVREFDDDHLMQEIKQADVYHSETPSNFERWQMVGLTSTPLKQDEEDKQQQSKPAKDEQGDWNHDQPKGPAAEAVMLYIGGARNHPIAMVDDRRVRPFKVPEGASAFYAASGTGQMVYHNDEGSYLVSVNNPKYGKDQKEKERFASLRHVKKKPQDRNEKKKSSEGSGSAAPSVVALAESGGSGGSSEQYKHEGEEVLTEVRTTSTHVEIRDGDTVVAVYNKSDKSWTFSNFKKLNLQPDDEFNVTTKKIVLKATTQALEIWGKPIEANGGGPTIPPFTVPG